MTATPEAVAYPELRDCKDPDLHKFLRRWESRHESYKERAQVEVHKRSLKGRLSYVDPRHVMDSGEVDAFTDDYLLERLPYYPFSCMNLKDELDLSEKPKRQFVDSSRRCPNCIRSGREDIGGVHCLRHSSNCFTEHHILTGDVEDDYYRPLKYSERCPPHSEFSSYLESHPYLFHPESHQLLNRTYRKLWNADPPRYKYFMERVNKMRKFIDCEPDPNYPRVMNKKIHCWSPPHKRVVPRRLTRSVQKGPYADPVVTVHCNNDWLRSLCSFKDVNVNFKKEMESQ